MRLNDAKTADRPRFDRLVVSNVLEWGSGPERQRLPEFAMPAAGQRFAPEDMALYWGGDRKIVVTRHQMDREHVADMSAIMGYESLLCTASPASQPGGSLCTDLILDEGALAQVAGLLEEAPADGPVIVEAYASTPEYARLVGELRRRTRRPLIDRMTPAGYLHMNRSLDSKLQVREYFETALPGCAAMRLTRAFPVRHGTDLRAQVQQALQVLGPAIIKTEFGAGGHALTVIDGTGDARKAVAAFLSSGYDGDLLIEEFLGADANILSVSYNGIISEDGKTFSLCEGAHFLGSGKYYLGSHLGVGSMPVDCGPKVHAASEAIAGAVASAGYRGPLNIDFLYRQSDGALFPLEINPRRTLGATLADICISLFGLGYEKTVSAVAMHSIPVHRAIRTYPELRDALLRKGWFGRETGGLVVLPHMVSSLASESAIGLAVLGSDGTSAAEALREITGYLGRRRWR
ncbi:MAG: hypothetical protein ACHP9Z_00675 [Streptosporangiales bacterium]